MKYTRWIWVPVLATMLAFSLPAGAAGRARQARGGQEKPPAKQEDPERAMTNVIRQMQMDLEAASRRGILGNIDSAKFEDYPRFEDMVDRLTREDALRVYFRQVSHTVKEDAAQMIIDAEMELTRKDSASQPERRRQQIVIDFARTARGWKIINITPRDFFRPL